MDHCNNIGYEEREVFIPNVITPNGDGLNDRFVLPPMLEGSKVSIFNRWGSEVYSSGAYDNKWNGGGLGGGVYYYSLTNECMNRNFKGLLTILK